MDCEVQDSVTRSPRSVRFAGSLCVALLVAGLAASCGPSDRPDPATWRDAWAAERATLPTERDLAGPNARGVCDRLLVSSRTARRRLLPSPDEALDRAVDDWIERVGGLAFDCPGAQGDAGAVHATIHEIDEIAAEVEAALRVMEGSPSARRPPGSG